MYCQKCNYKNNKGVTICERCGSKLEEAVVANPEPLAKGSKGTSSGKIIGIVIAVAAVLIAIVVAVMIILPGTNTTVPPAGGNNSNDNVSTEQTNSSNDNVSSDTNSGEGGEVDVEESNIASRGDVVEFRTSSQNGTSLSGKVRRDERGYVLAKSSTLSYSTAQLSAMNLNEAELCIASWEPYARKGMHFTNGALNRYFSSCSWYTDKGYSYGDISLDGPAYTNVTRIQSLLGANSPWLSLSIS